jgi:hypothetical protein
MKRREAISRISQVVLAAAGGACGSRSPTSPSPPAADFSAQFDSLWSTFDREYSYFLHKGIDWNALRAAFRPRATAAADQADFVGVVREMLGNLHDGHVFVRDPGGRQLATYSPSHFVNWDRSVWQQYIRGADWTPGLGDSGYGILDSVPYVTLAGWNTASVRSADVDAALERFPGAPAMIIDVRMNSGGDSQLAFDVAGRFTQMTVVTGYARFRNGPSHSDFGPPMQFTLSPRGSRRFTGTVLLLIGRRCASSNETFIAAMRQLPHVTLVGDQTAGSSGNPGTFPLANGWSYTVSRWIEYTADNQVIEDVGISPQAFVPADAGDFMRGRDPVLDWALSALRA